jgi:predicted metal-binding membrane protein
VVLLAIAAVAWAVTLVQGLQGMPMVTDVGVPIFMALWTAMMVAMMLPAALTMVLAFTRFQGAWRSLAFVGGYLLLWAAFGLGALAYARWPLPSLVSVRYISPVSGIVLGAAGLYQFSLPKDRCLTACRGPMEFLMTHARSGRLGALVMGLDHGLYCLGCCWAFMVALVVVGSMALPWVGLLALAIFAEKVGPGWAPVSKGIGVLFVVLGIVLALGFISFA